MNKSDEKRAIKKLTELFLKIAEPKQAKHISWDRLSEYRLEALKEETWENGVRIAILNYLQKEIPKQPPYLPTEVITFLEPKRKA